MTVRGRLVLLVTLLIATATISTAAVFATISWRAMVEQAKQDGILVARLLAQTLHVAQQVPVTVEGIVGQDMLAQAHLVAQMADLARRHGIPDAEVQRRLRESSARTGLGEVWVTDPKGTPTLSSLDEIDASVGEDSGILRNEAFAPLLDGRRFALVTEALRRDLDDRELAYAGVALPEGRGMALVARDASRLRSSGDRVGLRRLVETAMSGAPIDSVWVFGDTGEELAHTTVNETEGDGATPTDGERALARRVAGTADPEAVLTGSLYGLLLGQSSMLHVAAPLLDQDGLPSGTALLRLPTDRLHEAIRSLLVYAGGLTAGLLLAGVAATLLMARFISQPIMTVTRAAGEMEAKRFVPASLDATARRRDELGRLARVFQSMAREVLAREEELEGLVRARTHELETKNEQLQRAHAQMEEELLAAQSLQAAILPQQFPRLPTHECDAFMVPARQLGGDFYDLFAIDETHLAVTIADVSGKGVPAAFFMAISRTILQGTGKEGWPPGECLKRSNDLLCQTNPMALFVTVFYGILDIRTGEFRYANGGHNPPCLIRSADGEVRRLPPTDGIALGVMEEMDYDEGCVTLSPGDTVFLFTDGVSEAMDSAGNEFTEQRLTDTLARTHGLPLSSVLKRVRDEVHVFVGEAAQSDDLTCLVLRYAPKTAKPEAAVPTDSVELTLHE